MKRRLFFCFLALFLPSRIVSASELLPLPVPAKKFEEIKLKHREFTFVRIKYSSAGARSSWATDYPDAEMHLSFRLRQVTGLPTGKETVAELTDPKLKDYPFIYLSEGGALVLKADEIAALRTYLLNGGFLMVDDFWGQLEWGSLAHEMKRVFPELDPVDLPVDHPVFHCFFELSEKPQVPNIMVGIRSEDTGEVWERPDGKGANYRGIFDSKGRLMALLCHNTDLADGWENDGEHPYYSKEFSVKKAFPMGINIVLFALSN
jgi:hypothetical protein